MTKITITLKNTIITITVLLIVGFIAGWNFNPGQSITSTVDTVYVQLPPVHDTTIVTKDQMKFRTVTVVDSIKLREAIAFYEELIDSLMDTEDFDIIEVTDNKRFPSGDSLEVIYQYPPENKFIYSFFPRDDKLITITNYIDKTPKMSGELGVSGFVKSKDQLSGIALYGALQMKNGYGAFANYHLGQEEYSFGVKKSFTVLK